jgi:hypothetical protein
LKVKYSSLFLCFNIMLEVLLMRGFHIIPLLSGGGSTTVAPVHDGYVLQKVFIIYESNEIHLSHSLIELDFHLMKLYLVIQFPEK